MLYHINLSIAVCSEHVWLTGIVQTAVPLEHFSHSVAWYSSAESAPVALADILIVDMPTGGDLVALKAACKPNAVLVACATPEVIASLSDEALAAAWTWWELPLESRLTALRMAQLLQEIKLRKDYWLVCNYLDTAMDNVQDMIWFKDNSGRHLKVNQTFSAMVSKSKEDVTGKLHYYVWDIPEEEYKQGKYVCVETEDDVIAARKPCLYVEKVKTKHGMRQFKTYKSPIFDETGCYIIGTVGTAHDVTDLENISTELEVLLQSIPFAVLLRDNQDIVINVNDRFAQYFGVKKEEMLGSRFSIKAITEVMIDKRINNDGYTELTVRSNGDAGVRILEVQEEIIWDVFQNNVGKICIYRDVTHERELEERLLHNLNTDFLTGLYNRRYFYQHLAECRKAQPISLLYVDLDRFKSVNDTFGHKAGDDALLCTAEILTACFPGELIARLGGDEFIIALLGDYEMAQLECLAEQLIKRLHTRFCGIIPFFGLSASVGIAQTDDTELDIDIILHQSDTALYAAKKQGKGTYRIYTP